MAGVDTSAMYIGTIMVSMPTENPAIARPAVESQPEGSVYHPQICSNVPAKSIGIASAAACRAEPTVKMTTATKIDPLRPTRSATGPLTSDPNQANSRSVDTNQPLKLLSREMRGNLAANDSMVRTPETTPWS